MSDQSPYLLWLVLGSALPLLAVTATAFAKASVLLGILRGGLGTPDALPATVTTGLAALLAAVVMLPVGRQMVEAVGPPPDNTALAWTAAAERAWPVLQDFLDAHTPPERLAQVVEASVQLDPTAEAAAPSAADRITAFLISELEAAFQLGVLLLLPFLIVDLLVASTLSTIGFALLPPSLIALPFKLLLFVAADGWGLLVRGFLRSYG